MGDRRQWISVDECVAGYLDMSEQSTHKQFKCTQIAFNGMRQMGLDFFYTLKTVKLPVNANLTVNLPEDYLNYSKVGVFNDRSEIIPLIYNNKLTFFEDQTVNRQADTEDGSLFNFFDFNSEVFYNYWNGDIFENLYGLPSGGPFIGSFRIDNEAGLVVLGEGFTYPYIVLEYIASPKPQQGTYYLPFQFKEALMAYIAWQDIIYLPSSRRGNLGDKEQRKRNFYNERRLANARYRPLYLEQEYENNLRNQRLTVKA